MKLSRDLLPTSLARQVTILLFVAGMLLLARSIPVISLSLNEVGPMLFWALLIIVPGFFLFELAWGKSIVVATISEATEYAGILAIGAPLTAWFVTIRVLIDLLFVKKILKIHRSQIYSLGFNVGQYVLTIFGARLVFDVVSAASPPSLPLSTLPYVLSAIAFFAINTFLNTLLLWKSLKAPFWLLWWENWGKRTMLSFFGLAFIGYLIAKDYQGEAPRGAVVFLVLIALWLFRTRYRDQATIFRSDEDSLAMIATSLEARDSSTDKHSEHVAELSAMIGEEAGLEWGRKETLRRAARTHDLGKVATKDHILFEGRELSPDEYQLFKGHPIISEQILAQRKSLRKEAKIARHHHENFDGSGYPDRLKGEEIPLESRILRVADAFHAMISPRPYRRPRPKAEAVLELEAYSGRQFDPQVVRWFLAAIYKSEPDLEREVDLLKRTNQERSEALRAMGRPECFADYRCIEVCQRCPWVTECNEQTRQGLKNGTAPESETPARDVTPLTVQEAPISN